MTTQLKKVIFSLLMGVIFLASSSHADHLLVVSSDGGATFSNAFNVNVGDTVSVDFFLNETSTSSDLVDDGLIGFGLDVNHTTGLGDITFADPNTFFDLENHDVRLANGFEWEYFDSTSMGIRSSSILLGRLDFVATGLGTTTFTIGDRLVGSGFGDASWFTSTGGSLDTSIFGSDGTNEFTFTVSATAVPEPGSVVFLPALACLVFRRYRKRVV